MTPDRSTVLPSSEPVSTTDQAARQRSTSPVASAPPPRRPPRVAPPHGRARSGLSQLTPSRPAEVGSNPNISPAYTRLQVARVAEARGMSVAELDAVVDAHTRGRTLGFLGEPTVNVVTLNLDLDSRYPYRA
jgi:hypothetical protein